MIFNTSNSPVTITLFKDIPFDNQYKHHPLMAGDNGMHKQTNQYGVPVPISMWFETSFLMMKASNDVDYYFEQTELPPFAGYNFNRSNGLVTSITLEVPVPFTTANYMKVKSKTSGTQPEYYFITSLIINSVSENTAVCTLTLECDVIATYGIKVHLDTPVSTKRKHCQRVVQTSSPFTYADYCADVLIPEDIKVEKPKDIKGLVDLTPSDSGDCVSWLYVAVTPYKEAISEEAKPIFKWATTIGGSLSLPYCLFAIPLVNILKVKTGRETYEEVNVKEMLETEVFGNAYIIDAKISPNSPFTSNRFLTNAGYVLGSFTFSNGSDGKTLTCDIAYKSLTKDCFTFIDYDGNECRYIKGDHTESVHAILARCGFRVTSSNSNQHKMKDIYSIVSPIVGSLSSSNPRSVDFETKMHYSPYTRYCLSSRFFEEKEIYPELANAKYYMPRVELETYCFSSPSTGDNRLMYYNKIVTTSADQNIAYNYSVEMNNGVVISPNFSFPLSKTALEQFTATQSASFASSKIASAVGSIATTGLGFALGNPALIAGGTISALSTISSSIGKTIDLYNTPDSISNNANGVFIDFTINHTLPIQIIKYELTPVEKEIVLDYFYDYGYSVNRCCKFNQDLRLIGYSDSGWVDDRLFTREVFNYIKLDEDITTKIRGDIPLVCKQKIAKIFMDGIKLYTLINLEGNLNQISFEKYYEKNTYENAEITKRKD